MEKLEILEDKFKEKIWIGKEKSLLEIINGKLGCILYKKQLKKKIAEIGGKYLGKVCPDDVTKEDAGKYFIYHIWNDAYGMWDNILGYEKYFVLYRVTKEKILFDADDDNKENIRYLNAEMLDFIEVKIERNKSAKDLAEDRKKWEEKYTFSKSDYEEGESITMENYKEVLKLK
jgi:hypothetical protein